MSLLTGGILISVILFVFCIWKIIFVGSQADNNFKDKKILDSINKGRNKK